MPLTLTAPGGGVSRWTYNANGTTASVTTSSGNTTTYERDLLGRVTKITHPDGAARQFAYDAGDRIAQQTDENGKSVNYWRNQNNQLAARTDELGATELWSYNASSLPVQATDRLGNKATYSYNRNNLISKITNALGDEVEFAYDSAGRMTAIKDVIGTRAEFAYNKEGVPATNQLEKMKMNTLSTLCLVAIGAAASLDAQTVARPGSRSLRARDLLQKASSTHQVLVAPDVDHVFPYILASGAWTTTFYLTNLEEREISVHCEFVSPNGEELSMKFNFSRNDETTAFTTSVIPAFSTGSFSTISTATALTTAWAYCSAEPRTERFSGYAVVKNTAANGAMREFITTLHPEKEPVFSVPFTDAAAGRTALILLNSALEEESSLALWTYDAAGKPAGTGTITLKPGNLRVIVLNDVFKDMTTGTIRVVSVEGAKSITGLALRTNPAGYAVFTPLRPQQAPAAQ